MSHFNTSPQPFEGNPFLAEATGTCSHSWETTSRMKTQNVKLVACSHHKAGSNFTIKLFQNIARLFNRKLWMAFYHPTPPPTGWDICVHQHARVEDIIQKDNFMGWHCVRHPKSLIYSAALYHQKSTEPWLDIPLKAFSSQTYWAITNGLYYNTIKDKQIDTPQKVRILSGDYTHQAPDRFLQWPANFNMNGLTYREFLSRLPSFEEKLIFEMRSFSRGVINDMLSFPRDQRFYFIHLESISHDPEMTDLRASFSHMGFDKQDIDKCLDAARAHCLWHIGKKSINHHATTGMSNDWQTFFRGEVEEEYRRLFGYAEQRLGYFE